MTDYLIITAFLGFVAGCVVSVFVFFFRCPHKEATKLGEAAFKLISSLKTRNEWRRHANFLTNGSLTVHFDRSLAGKASVYLACSPCRGKIENDVIVSHLFADHELQSINEAAILTFDRLLNEQCFLALAPRKGEEE